MAVSGRSCPCRPKGRNLVYVSCVGRRVAPPQCRVSASRERAVAWQNGMAWHAYTLSVKHEAQATFPPSPLCPARERASPFSLRPSPFPLPLCPYASPGIAAAQGQTAVGGCAQAPLQGASGVSHYGSEAWHQARRGVVPRRPPPPCPSALTPSLLLTPPNQHTGLAMHRPPLPGVLLPSVWRWLAGRAGFESESTAAAHRAHRTPTAAAAAAPGGRACFHSILRSEANDGSGGAFFVCVVSRAAE